jgi:hypothetical protein
MTDLPTLFHVIWDLLPLVVLFLLWLDWDAHSRSDDLEQRLDDRTESRTGGGEHR